MHQKKVRATLRPAFAYAIERLEGRQLLCGLPMDDLIAAPVWSEAVEAVHHHAGGDGGSADGVSILWANRSVSSGPTNDYFADVFGAGAEAARKVVDQVLADWSKAITSWNRSDNSTTLTVNISMLPTGTGFGATAAPSATNVPSDGKPRSGSMTIGRGLDTNGDGKGDGVGWLIDPTPASSSEYMSSSFLNAFAGYSNSSQNDLYSLVNLEMTHVLGLISGTSGNAFNGYKLFTSGLTTTTSSPDLAEAGSGNTSGTLGYYATFKGNTITHLMTTNNGGSGGSNWGSPIHTAGSGANVTIGGITYRGSEDSGNAVYDSARYMVSEVVLRMLGDAYGYSIQDPKTLPTLLAQVNDSGVLNIRGLPGTSQSPDVILVDQSGSNITVSVDLGNDVPGTGALPGAGDLSAYVATFNASSVNSIVIDGGDGNDTIVLRGIKPTTINGSDGNDNIRIRGVVSGANISINGGTGDDAIAFGNLDPTLDDLGGNVTVAGGAGNDTLRLDDDGDIYGDTYTLNTTSFSRSAAAGSIVFSESEIVRLTAGSGANTFNVNGIANGTALDITCGGGADTVVVGNHNLYNIVGSLTVHGGGNGDVLTLDDVLQTSAVSFALAATTLKRADLAGVVFDGFATLGVNAGTGADVFNVTPASNIAFNINGGGPSSAPGDTLNLALSGVTGATNSSPGSSSGTWSFTNRASINYSGIETQTSTGGNAAPTISSLGASPSSLASGQAFSLTASGVADADGNLASVSFYRESNGLAGLQPGSDQLISYDTFAGDGWGLVVSTSGYAAGIYTYYAQATDAAGATSAVATTSISVAVGNQPPSINGGLFAIPNPVAVNGTFALLAGTVSDSDGVVTSVTFYKDTNGIGGLQIGSDQSVGIDTFANDGWFLSGIAAGLTAGTYTYYAVATDNGGAQSAPEAISIVVTASAPVVVQSVFSAETAPLHVDFTFDSDVSASLSATDLYVRNVATSAVVTVDSVSWNSASRVASFTLHGIPADGNYQATIFASNITNGAGTAMTSDASCSFFMKAGDANHDRAVNFADLVILAQNYNKSGRTLSQGNVNYSADGKVDFADLVLLAQHYNTTLAPAAASLLAPATSKTAKRSNVAAQVL